MVPRHFGNLEQPQKLLPIHFPRLATLATILVEQRGQAGGELDLIVAVLICF